MRSTIPHLLGSDSVFEGSERRTCSCSLCLPNLMFTFQLNQTLSSISYLTHIISLSQWSGQPRLARETLPVQTLPVQFFWREGLGSKFRSVGPRAYGVRYLQDSFRSDPAALPLYLLRATFLLWHVPHSKWQDESALACSFFNKSQLCYTRSESNL